MQYVYCSNELMRSPHELDKRVLDTLEPQEPIMIHLFHMMRLES